MRFYFSTGPIPVLFSGGDGVLGVLQQTLAIEPQQMKQFSLIILQPKLFKLPKTYIFIGYRLTCVEMILIIFPAGNSLLT
jgi:hypothetical protein